MSYFSFLTTPDKLGVVSCVSTEGESSLLTHEAILEYCNILKDVRAPIINQLANKGRIVLDGHTITQENYNKEYEINADWSLVSHRASRDQWFYLLIPKNIQAKVHFKTGLKKIASRFISDNVNVSTWVRYEHLSKLFYLKEFGEILNDPKLIKAIMHYTELYSVKDYEEWLEHYQWPYPQMVFTHRLYLKRHIQYHTKQLKSK